MNETNDQNEVRVPFVNTDDPTLLLVRGNIENDDERKRYIKALADAVLAVYCKHHKVNLRCVGAAAVNNADKAIIIATGEAIKKGVFLATVPSFQLVSFDGGVTEKTAILKTVRKVEFVE